jgi:hypothetical protein
VKEALAVSGGVGPRQDCGEGVEEGDEDLSERV